VFVSFVKLESKRHSFIGLNVFTEISFRFLLIRFHFLVHMCGVVSDL